MSSSMKSNPIVAEIEIDAEQVSKRVASAPTAQAPKAKNKGNNNNDNDNDNEELVVEADQEASRKRPREDSTNNDIDQKKDKKTVRYMEPYNDDGYNSGPAPHPEQNEEGFDDDFLHLNPPDPGLSPNANRRRLARFEDTDEEDEHVSDDDDDDSDGDNNNDDDDDVSECSDSDEEEERGAHRGIDDVGANGDEANPEEKPKKKYTREEDQEWIAEMERILNGHNYDLQAYEYLKTSYIEKVVRRRKDQEEKRLLQKKIDELTQQNLGLQEAVSRGTNLTATQDYKAAMEQELKKRDRKILELTEENKDFTITFFNERKRLKGCILKHRVKGYERLSHIKRLRRQRGELKQRVKELETMYLDGGHIIMQDNEGHDFVANMVGTEQE